MAEMKSSPTKKQLLFIDRLRSASEEREDGFQEVLKSLGKGDVSELDMKEASQVIDALKKIEVEGEAGGPGSPTDKQLSFLHNLQDSEERISATSKFLKKVDKKTMGNLTVSEASELIDSLTKIKGGPRVDTSSNPATEKQLFFINRLQNSDETKKQYRALMKKFGKEDPSDLTKGEASQIIEKMKEKR